MMRELNFKSMLLAVVITFGVVVSSNAALPAGADAGGGGAAGGGAATGAAEEARAGYEARVKTVSCEATTIMREKLKEARNRLTAVEDVGIGLYRTFDSFKKTTEKAAASALIIKASTVARQALEDALFAVECAEFSENILHAHVKELCDFCAFDGFLNIECLRDGVKSHAKDAISEACRIFLRIVNVAPRHVPDAEKVRSVGLRALHLSREVVTIEQMKEAAETAKIAAAPIIAIIPTAGGGAADGAAGGAAGGDAGAGADAGGGAGAGAAGGGAAAAESAVASGGAGGE